MRRFAVHLIATGLLASLLIAVAGSPLRATTVLVDFEQFADTTNLNGVNLGGVTLYGPTGLVEVFDNRFGAAYHSPTKAVTIPAGLLTLNPLIGVFDTPVSYVSLWGGDAGTYDETDSWELLVYDAPTGGNLIGQVASGPWRGDPYRELSIAADKIWRFEANWTGSEFGIGYDDLRFTPYESRNASNASFADDQDQDELVLDFGELTPQNTSSSILFDLWNLPSTADTVDLDLADLTLVDFSGSSTLAFNTSLAPFTGLAPSTSKSFSASLITNEPGVYSATYLLSVTDVTGTPQAPLKIVLTGRVVPVPEPSTMVLALAGLVVLLAYRRLTAC